MYNYAHVHTCTCISTHLCNVYASLELLISTSSVNIFGTSVSGNCLHDFRWDVFLCILYEWYC